MKFEEYLETPLPYITEIDRYLGLSNIKTVFEIGVCEGEDTIKLSRAIPGAIIHGFEPLSKNIARINKNLKQHGVNCALINKVALSEKNGTSTFYESSGHPDFIEKEDGWDYGNKSSSLLPPKETKKVHPWLKFNKNITVKTLTLDTYCKHKNIKHIDFIHMDVQGAELMVLKGAGDMMQNIDAIWLEVEAVELYSSQPLRPEIESEMEKWGFVCVKSTVDNVSGDQLYIQKNILKSKYRKLSDKINKTLRWLRLQYDM